MRRFNPLVHEVVLLDECPARITLKCRKLLQAGNADVEMAGSTTNCHGYTVYGHCVKFVICSNRWEEELGELPAADSA